MMDVELRDISIDPRGPSEGWSATLYVNGNLIGSVSPDPDDVFRLDKQAENISDSELFSLHEAMAREDAESGRWALGVRCVELIAWEWMRIGLSELLEVEAIGVVGEGPSSELRGVAVPDGSTLSGAVAFLRKTEPGIVILNGMDIDEAVEAYARVFA